MHGLRVSLIELGIASVLTLGITATPAAAVPVEEVLAACDQREDCAYSTDADGTIHGYMTNGGSQEAFVCPADGSGECTYLLLKLGDGRDSQPGTASSGGAVPVKDVKEVLEACDRTEGCSYSTDADGTVRGYMTVGGSQEASFVCPADGSGECTFLPIKLLVRPGRQPGTASKNKALQPARSRQPGASTMGGAVPARDGLLGKKLDVRGRQLGTASKNKALQPGLLETGGAGFSIQGPAATGTIVAPPAAAPGPVLQ